jgi:hypothetical protein
MYEKPSQESIYQSTYHRKVINDEQQRAEDKFRLSKDPLNTGIINKDSFGDAFSSIDNVQTLTGEQMIKEDFTHNNMTPFLRGNVTQNMNPSINNSRLSYHTGIDEHFISKKETETSCFFKQTSGIGNVCGMKNNDDFFKSRLDNPISHNNTFPIQPIRVGPGINAGYTSKPSGGFNQSDTRKFATPVDIYKNKPKTNQSSRTFNLPIGGSRKNINESRTLSGKLDKNLPDTSFEQNSNQWFKTTGAYSKESNRDTIQNIKDTNVSMTHVEYKGAPTNGNEHGNGLKDDYNKKNVLVYDNERNVTQSRTHISNVSHNISAIIAPLSDVLKDTLKTFTLDAARPFGNIQSQIPSKQTTYDNISHIMKTTIKETNIHNSDNLNLKGEDGTYSATQDQARTTVKETNIHDSDKLNLKGEDGTYTATQDQARTTVKETNIHDSDKLNLKGEDGTYTATQDQARTTVKETNIHDSDKLNLKGEDGTYTATQDQIRTTIKETNIHNASVNNLKGGNAGQMQNEDKAKKTNKETLPVYTTVRNINSQSYNVTSYNPDAAKTIIKKTMKETTVNSKNTYGWFGGFVNSLFGGSETFDAHLDNTHRQYISDNEHIGISGAKNTKYMSHEFAENFEHNNDKETLMNINYTPGGGGGYTGQSKDKIKMKSNNLPSDSLSGREVQNPDKVYQKHAEIGKITKENTQLNATGNRLDPLMINSLNSNPFNLNINKQY